MSNIEFCIAEDSDIKDIYNIQKDVITNPWSYEMTLGDYKEDNSKYFCIKVDEVIAGYIVLKVVLEDADIMSVGVKENYRKLGYGEMLIQKSMEYLKSENVLNVFLDVRASNYKAINLYKKLNFVEISLRKKYYKAPIEDAVIMKKTI